jgi:hypothetical protein
VTGPWIVALIAVAALSVVTATFVLGLLRRIAVLLEGLEYRARTATSGLPVGTRVTSFEAVDDTGGTVRSEELLKGPGILLFVSEGCAPCLALLQKLAAHEEPLTRIPLFAIARGDIGLNAADVGRLTVFRDGTAFHALNVATTPLALAIDAEGDVVAASIPSDLESLRELEGMLEKEVVAGP